MTTRSCPKCSLLMARCDFKYCPDCGAQLDSLRPSDATTCSVVAPNLFDINSVAMDSPRLASIKVADIRTHHAPHMEEAPWLAIPMHAARERLKGYISKEEQFNTVADITASFGRVLDDCGMLFYGQTEREAQDAALASLSNANCAADPPTKDSTEAKK